MQFYALFCVLEKNCSLLLTEEHILRVFKRTVGTEEYLELKRTSNCYVKIIAWQRN